jgi:23S rRNA pseudouridine1911/1915/1917 synthase
VIVPAQTHHALNHLQSQFKRRTIYKRYLALVEGVPSSPAGVIEASIGRDPGQRKRMAVTHDGREAITRYSTLETFEHHCLIAVEMQTGRTHQIRVHMAWLGHPVVGDRVYGFRKQRISLRRFFLHASDLHIDSPSRGERLRFAAPLPPELDTVLQALRQGTF